MKPIILFTGHRYKKANTEDIRKLAEKYDDCIWIHGGAIGFDSQVDDVAEVFGIQRIIVPPAYNRDWGVPAPLARNDIMLELCNRVVALYDGRKRGGTLYTINRAYSMGLPVKILQPA